MMPGYGMNWEWGEKCTIMNMMASPRLQIVEIYEKVLS